MTTPSLTHRRERVKTSALNLGSTSVCTSCGAVYSTNAGHSCSRRSR